MSLLSSFLEHLEAIGTGLKYLFFSKRMTVRYPEVVIELRPGYRGMIRWHKERCICCSMCARICPAAAIRMYRIPGEKKMRPGINYQRCIFCGFCVDICPTDALECTTTHDVAFEKLEDMMYPPDKFDREWVSPALEEGARKLKVEFDEEWGLKHVPE